MRACIARGLVPIATAAVLVAAGCSRPTGPDVQFVSGVVLHDGQPVVGANIAFHPVAGGIAASGLTAADGAFRLTSDRRGRGNGGAVAGDYVVTVTKWRNDSPPLPEDAKPGLSDAEYAQWKRTYDAALAAQKPPVSVLPEKYRLVEKSDLRATVRKGRNEFRFELTTQ